MSYTKGNSAHNNKGGNMTTLTSFNLHPGSGALEIGARNLTGLGGGPDHFTVHISVDYHDVTIFLKSVEELDAFADKVSQSVLDISFQDQQAV